jgi:hypothetical protein
MFMMLIDNKYELGQTVYLKTDNEQLSRVVTALGILPGQILYELSQGSSSSKHYDFEITPEKNLVENI